MEQGEADLILLLILAKALCPASPLKCCVERSVIPHPNLDTIALQVIFTLTIPSPPGEGANPVLLSLSDPPISSVAPHLPLNSERWNPSKGLWISGGHPKLGPGVFRGLGVCVLGVILRLPTLLVPSPLLLFVSFAPSLFVGK